MGKFKNKPQEAQGPNLREEPLKITLLEANGLVSRNLLQTPGCKICVFETER